MAPRKKDFYLLHPLHSLEVDDAQKWIGTIAATYTELRTGYVHVDEATRSQLLVGPKEELSNVKTVIESLRSESMKATFLEFLGVSLEQYSKTKETFKSHKVNRIRIHQDQTALNLILGSKRVQTGVKELQVGITKPYWFIVGLLSTTTASSYDVSQETKDKFKGNADPGAMATAATGTPLAGGQQINLEMQNTQDANTKFAVKANAPQEGHERIFAVEYRSFHYIGHGTFRTALGHGPQGDGAFAGGKAEFDEAQSSEEEGDTGPTAKLDDDEFDEVADVRTDDRYFSLEE